MATRPDRRELARRRRRRRRVRRWSVRGGLAFALIVLLGVTTGELGHGGGGAEPDPAPGHGPPPSNPDSAGTTAARDGRAAGDGSASAADGGVEPGGGVEIVHGSVATIGVAALAVTGETGDGVGPARVGGQRPATAGPAVELASPSAAAIADRVWGCLRGVAAARDVAALDRAHRSLERVTQLPLDAEQSAEIAAAREVLARRLEQALARMVDALRGGRVLDVADDWRAMESASVAVADPARRHAAARRWPEPRIRPGGTVELATPDPIVRGTTVRARSDAGVVTAPVAASHGARVVLRTEVGGGFAFPSVPRTAIDLVDPDARIAIDQAVIALQAGDPSLAAVWLAAAIEIGGADAARLAQVRAVLDQ